MNALLTCAWIITATVVSFFLSRHFSPTHLLMYTSLGFMGSILIRFVPVALAEGVADGLFDGFFGDW